LILLFTIALAIIIFIYILFHLKTKDTKKVVGASYVSRIAGPELFKSTYFEFSDTEKWVFDAHDSTANSFTYIIYQNGSQPGPSGDAADTVTVFVNQTPIQDELAVTHVLPVQIKDDNAFIVGSYSEACGSTYGPKDLQRIKTISLSGTSMLCVPDSPEFTAEVGQIGGNYNLTLKRNNGQDANYIIIFKDQTYNTNPTPFLKFLNNFQAI
jgi:hypothetical protein